MNFQQVCKIMSSDLESKLVIHFFNCRCHKNDVSDMVQKLKVAQPTLSKHINKLLNQNILEVKSIGKNRYYSINKTFKKKWNKLLRLIIELPENEPWSCRCLKNDLNRKETF